MLESCDTFRLREAVLYPIVAVGWLLILFLELKPTFEPSGLLAQDDTSQKEQVLEKNGVALKVGGNEIIC